MLRINRPLSVLYVEDDPEAARLFLRRLNWFRAVTLDVVHVADLQGALERLATDHFDLLLLDLALPDGNEMSTLAAAGAMARRIPIVILTGNGDPDVSLLAARLGVQSYLEKEQQDGLSVGRALVEAFERHRWVRAPD